MSVLFLCRRIFSRFFFYAVYFKKVFFTTTYCCYSIIFSDYAKQILKCPSSYPYNTKLIDTADGITYNVTDSVTVTNDREDIVLQYNPSELISLDHTDIGNPQIVEVTATDKWGGQDKCRFHLETSGESFQACFQATQAISLYLSGLSITQYLDLTYLILFQLEVVFFWKELQQDSWHKCSGHMSISSQIFGYLEVVENRNDVKIYMRMCRQFFSFMLYLWNCIISWNNKICINLW